MNLPITLLICCGALVLGFIKNSERSRYLLLFVNTLVVFLLQPTLPIRTLGFWLPFLTLAISVVCWAVISNGHNIIIKENIVSSIIIISVCLIPVLVRLLGILPDLLPNKPPQFILLIFGIVIILIIAIISHRAKSKIPLLYILLLILFLIIQKSPSLLETTSYYLRYLTKQSVELANSFDIRWLGFSYIAFRVIHTLREHQNGKLAPIGLADYVNYITFFPSLVAGPIDRLDHFQKEITKSNKFSYENSLEGGKRVFLGIFKKFVIADGLALLAINNSNVMNITSPVWLWISLYAFSIQLFFDFSGYTDIAIGMGQFIGIKLPENFSSPYLKPNLTLFWNNWHITLTQWFRSYVFNPLTRKLRSSERKMPVFSIIFLTQFVTMIMIGLWHGISWNFVLWGAWHGIGLFLHNRWSIFAGNTLQTWADSNLKKKIIKITGIFLTFNYVTIGWVFFALSSPALSLDTISRLVGIQ